LRRALVRPAESFGTLEANQEISRQELESFIGERLTDAGV
jgi:hypothetical protein